MDSQEAKKLDIKVLVFTTPLVWNATAAAFQFKEEERASERESGQQRICLAVCPSSSYSIKAKIAALASPAD